MKSYHLHFSNSLIMVLVLLLGGGSKVAPVSSLVTQSASGRNLRTTLQRCNFSLSSKHFAPSLSTFSSIVRFQSPHRQRQRQRHRHQHLLEASRDKSTNNNNNNIQVPTWVPDGNDDSSGYSRPVIQWYPGHIAKAERLLKETFQAVDVVVEVRDARAPKATSHPRVAEWCSGRPRLVVFTHVDLVPTFTQRAWKQYYEEQAAAAAVEAAAAAAVVNPESLFLDNDDSNDRTDISSSGEEPSTIVTEHDINPNNSKATIQYLWVNAKQGQGIPALHRAIFKAGSYVQERRQRRGLKDRPLRVGLMGYPNVGKSALINRLLGTRRARTANIPGVTRSLQWIRVRTDDSKKTNKKEYELLDSPGIIPASLEDQSDALLLAACNCIGEASYDNQVVASYLCQWMINLMISGRDSLCAPGWRDASRNRWGIDPLKPVPTEHPAAGVEKNENASTKRYITGEEMLYMVADNKCKSSPEDAARKILQDFRAGRMGDVCLQLAPTADGADDVDAAMAFSQVPDPRMGTMRTEASSGWNDWEKRKAQQEADALERAQNARELAKERGLELPPQLENLVAAAADTPPGALDGDGERIEGSKKQSVKTDEVGKGLFEGW